VEEIKQAIMGFITIKLPIEQGEKFGVVNFDKETFAKENQLYLSGDPLVIQKDGMDIVLIYKGHVRDLTEEEKQAKKNAEFLSRL